MSDQQSSTKKTFAVVDGPLKIRTLPNTDPAGVVQGKILKNGDQIDVDPISRTEAAGYVWWKHAAGWSAERTVDGKETYMVLATAVPAAQPAAAPAQTQPPATQAPPATPASAPVSQPAPQTITQPAAQPASQPAAQPSAKKTFLVVDGPVSIRSEPHTEPRLVIAGKTLNSGDQVDVDPASRTEADGYVWWKHAAGWSAEKSLGGSDVFMIVQVPGQATPQQPGGFWFEKLPVAFGTFQWFYYYGNTEFAFQNGQKFNYDGYSQGLHGGIDFGHPGGATITAGVTGTFGGTGKAFPPNRLDVVVGKYRIIYGHLANPATNLSLGQPITPDTPMGQVDGGMKHTHIEVRTSDGRFIVNPLQFIPEALRNQIFAKFPPKGEFGFHAWPQWQTPMDQPDILLAGKVVGPRAKP